MNKILIGGGILLGSILLVENFILSQSAYILIWYWNTWSLTMFSIFIWIIFWYWIKWLIAEKSTDKYDDEGLNF